MVVLRIKELELDNPEDHIATDWQVSRTLAFNDIVLESIEDHSNITYIKWNDILDPNQKYYARARALLDGKGYTVWGNLDIYETEKVNDLTFTSELPSKVSLPILTSDSPKTSHDAALFTLRATGFTVVGSSTHLKTSWFIEDLEGNVVWSRLDDHINKESITVRDVVLETGHIYRVRAMFISNTNDKSQLATMTIKVADTDDVELLTYLNDLDVTVDNEVKVASLPGITNTDWEIIIVSNNNAETIWTQSVSGVSTTIAANVLERDTNYLLRVKTNVNDQWEHIPFRIL